MQVAASLARKSGRVVGDVSGALSGGATAASWALRRDGTL